MAINVINKYDIVKLVKVVSLFEIIRTENTVQ